MDLASSCITKIIRKGEWTVAKLNRVGQIYERIADRMIEASTDCSCDAEKHIKCDNWKHRVMIRWERLFNRLDRECRKSLKIA